MPGDGDPVRHSRNDGRDASVRNGYRSFAGQRTRPLACARGEYEGPSGQRHRVLVGLSIRLTHPVRGRTWPRKRDIPATEQPRAPSAPWCPPGLLPVPGNRCIRARREAKRLAASVVLASFAWFPAGGIRPGLHGGRIWQESYVFLLWEQYEICIFNILPGSVLSSALIAQLIGHRNERLAG